ncbi:MAG: class II aldolase/adducin family protein [Rhodospirillaceae bacterium]|mgnify:CR=1 FL=1|nr:class II aldolase/adducin family protein [Rhodospirillaceae bacterium]
MATAAECLKELVIANRILAHEGVVDAFGHISVRHPDDPEKYLLSVSRAPELITPEDIVEFRLDGEPVNLGDRTPYGERFIHGSIYEKRPDVNSVIHNHSHEIIPFGVTKTQSLRAIAHVGSVIGVNVDTWDIRDRFGDQTDLLVVNMDQGYDLAATLGSDRIALMRGHGAVVTGANIREAVMSAVYLQVNAKLQMQALQLGEPTYLSEGEVASTFKRQMSPLGLDRAWEYWVVRSGCATM